MKTPSTHKSLWDYEAYAGIPYDGKRHETLSPSNKQYDLSTKRQAYERCGVPEYWIVFPEEHKILPLVLKGGTYEGHERTDEMTMSVAAQTRVNLRQVW